MSGTKDQIDGNQGRPVYQTVDYAKISAVLWSALRGAIDRIEKLEEQVKKIKEKISGNVN